MIIYKLCLKYAWWLLNSFRLSLGKEDIIQRIFNAKVYFHFIVLSNESSTEILMNGFSTECVMVVKRIFIWVWNDCVSLSHYPYTTPDTIWKEWGALGKNPVFIFLFSLLIILKISMDFQCEFTEPSFFCYLRKTVLKNIFSHPSTYYAKQNTSRYISNIEKKAKLKNLWTGGLAWKQLPLNISVALIFPIIIELKLSWTSMNNLPMKMPFLCTYKASWFFANVKIGRKIIDCCWFT